MTNTNKDAAPQPNIIPPHQPKNIAIGSPDETVVKPAIILPITDGDTTLKNNETDAITTIDETDTNEAGDVIDNGNNYTAAENDHGTNATL